MIETKLLYPPTVDDDTVLQSDETSEDDDDEGLKVKKKSNKKKSMDFADGFVFEDESASVEVDGLKGLRPYMKKGLIDSLERGIERERMKLLKKHGDTFEKQESFPELVQEMEDISDNVRDKVRKSRREQKVVDFFDEKTSRSALEAEPTISFDQMGISKPILKAITACEYNEPTRIQSACIPVALAGRDICACAATGTGKTAAFMVPILERLLYRPNQKSSTRVIVLTPTRELAIQIFQVSKQLAQFMQVEICLCAGGLDIKAQEAALRQRPDIVIATPGRLIDHLHNAPNFTLHDIEILVLDEADRMLEEAFSDQMKEIIRLCSFNRQTMLLSATMTDQVEDLVTMSLKNPVKLFINENTDTAQNLRQEFIRIRENRENDRECIVTALVTRNFPDHTMVFVQTKKCCQRLHIVLGLLGVKVGQLHSSLSQSQRIEALHRFKTGALDVLVSTDLAARGLDVEGVQTVINMNMPVSLKHYVHRVGRTARAGRVGRAISLVGEGERKILKEVVSSNKGNTLKQRLISAEVIDAYRNRIDGLKESIENIEMEEKAERALRLAQEELDRGKAKIEGKVQKRNWMKMDKSAGKQQEKLRKAKRKQTGTTMQGEDLLAQREADYQVRAAKRARKGKKIRAVVEENHPIKKKKRKMKSSFTTELTSVGTKAVKRFRYGPDDVEFSKEKRKRRKK